MDKPTFGSIDLMHQLVAEHQREPLALELVDKEGPGLAVCLELKIEGPGHE